MTVLVDTSAWIEFLRDTGSRVCETVDGLLSGEIAICEIVSMEVLAGARDDLHLARLQGLLARARMIAITPGDYDHAAVVYRTCRQRGATVRSLVDCCIASIALRVDVPILHADRDFATIARHTPLRLHPPSV